MNKLLCSCWRCMYFDKDYLKTHVCCLKATPLQIRNLSKKHLTLRLEFVPPPLPRNALLRKEQKDRLRVLEHRLDQYVSVQITDQTHPQLFAILHDAYTLGLQLIHGQLLVQHVANQKAQKPLS